MKQEDIDALIEYVEKGKNPGPFLETFLKEWNRCNEILIYIRDYIQPCQWGTPEKVEQCYRDRQSIDPTCGGRYKVEKDKPIFFEVVTSIVCILAVALCVYACYHGREYYRGW